MPRIEHVVVLMLENRSFDNVLGCLYPKSDRFEGLDLTESNLWHRPDGTAERIAVWSKPGPASCLPDQDPGELFDDFTMQIFGLDAPPGAPPTMGGFVDNYMRQKQAGHAPDPHAIMHHFLPEQVPVMTTLAKAFAVSDRWHASAPCETWPNRYFAHAGTAGGYVNNERSRFPYRWPRFLPTIFRRMEARGQSWRVYFHDLPQAATLVDLWPRIPTRFCLFDAEFARHARSGRLPAYSFIEPRYYASSFSQMLPSDQHPPHDIVYGEQLVAKVYNAVRQAPTWERTLLIITYDEHGGCFDHVPPPPAVPPGGPYPDGFTFDRYGVRVPAIIVSPYVPSGSVVRPAPQPNGKGFPFDHCSIQATLHRLFDLGPPLTPRVAAAPDLLPALTLAAPSNNGPEELEIDPQKASRDELRAYRRRLPNRHQANLRSPMHGLPAAAARVIGHLRRLGATLSRND
jgi:phospholipase C